MRLLIFGQLLFRTNKFGKRETIITLFTFTELPLIQILEEIILLQKLWIVVKLMQNQLTNNLYDLTLLGDNTKLINHYKDAGFNFLGVFHLKNTDNLPKHYQEELVCLFEIELVE